MSKRLYTLLASKIILQHKITLPQLKKYDITQKVISALADAESRVILFSIIRKGQTASDLSRSLKIPLSSVYKKLSDLENLTLVRVEKTILSEKGRRFKIYRSRINKAEISIKNQSRRFHYLPTNYYERYTSKTNTAGT